MTMSNNGYSLFCDGACSGNPGPGGWGAILVSPESEVREVGGSRSRTTNNQMELTAAIEGLKLIPPGKAIASVYTDSIYVINGITKWVNGWKAKGWISSTGQPVANQDLWERLILETERLGKKQIRWNYVPGHEGIAGNERADAIAVAHSKNLEVVLYRGLLDDYGISILPVVLNDHPLPQKGMLKPKGRTYYLSLVNGVVEKHDTWTQCEARVKGRPNAKYKKVTSSEEEKALLKVWGLAASP